MSKADAMFATLGDDATDEERQICLETLANVLERQVNGLREEISALNEQNRELTLENIRLKSLDDPNAPWEPSNEYVDVVLLNIGLKGLPNKAFKLEAKRWIKAIRDATRDTKDVEPW